MDKTKRNKEKTKDQIGGTDYGEEYVHNLEKLEEESNDLAALRCKNLNITHRFNVHWHFRNKIKEKLHKIRGQDKVDLNHEEKRNFKLRLQRI